MRIRKMLTIIAAGMIVTAVAAPVALVLGGVLLLSFNGSSYYQPAMAQQQEITDTDTTTTTGLNTSITTANTTTQSQTSESEDVNTLYSRGYEAYEQGMYQQAIEYFDRVLAIDPNFLDALNYKGNSLLDLGRYQEAIECYDRALAIDANYVKALNNKGNALYYLGRYQEAIEYYDRALAIDPNYANAFLNKGIALEGLGRYEEAIENYDRVLAIDPNYVNVLIDKGNALVGLQRYEEAMESYDRVLAIEPNHVDALYNKGVALDNLGYYQEAIEYYDRVLAIAPNDIDALYNKGVDLGYLERYQEAIEYYDRVLAIDPNYLNALINKGNALAGLQRYQEAIGSYDRALAIEPNSVAALTNRALALDSLGGGGNVTTTTTTTTSTNATTSGGGGGNSTDFLTYDNATYGVTIQYPSNWVVDNTDFPGDPLTQIVTFFSPLESRLDTYEERLWIAQEQQSFSEDFDLAQYAEQIVSNYNSTLIDFSLDEIDTETARLGNNDTSPAYRMVYTYAVEFVDSPGVTVDLKSMEIGTVIGDKLYIVEYDAEPARYDQYLPIIEEMINSVQLSDSGEVDSDTTTNITTTQSQTSESEDVNTLFSRGYEAYEQMSQQALEEAIEYFDRVLAIDPNFLDALNYKGSALSSLGRYEEAIEYFDRVLAINPNDVDTLYNKGDAVNSLGRYQEAIEYYDRVLAIEPNHFPALHSKADTLLDLGRYQEAIEYYDRVLAIEPNHFPALMSREDALYNLGGGGNVTTTTTTTTSTNATTSGGGGNATDDIVTIVSHRPLKEPLTFPPVQEEMGITFIIGEVRNDSPNTIGEVNVRGMFYDSNGQLIHLAEYGPVALSVLRPGERAPFHISINDASISRSIANYTLSPEIGSSNAINKTAALKVAIGDHGAVETQEHVAGIVYEIVGTVTNMGNRPSTYVTVIATFYDAAGKVIDYGIGRTSPAEIPPGVTADIRFEDEPLGASGNWTAETNSVVSINVTAESAEYLSVIEPSGGGGNATDDFLSSRGGGGGSVGSSGGGDVLQ